MRTRVTLRNLPSYGDAGSFLLNGVWEGLETGEAQGRAMPNPGLMECVTIRPEPPFSLRMDRTRNLRRTDQHSRRDGMLSRLGCVHLTIAKRKVRHARLHRYRLT